MNVSQVRAISRSLACTPFRPPEAGAQVRILSGHRRITAGQRPCQPRGHRSSQVCRYPEACHGTVVRSGSRPFTDSRVSLGSGLSEAAEKVRLVLARMNQTERAVTVERQHGWARFCRVRRHSNAGKEDRCGEQTSGQGSTQDAFRRSAGCMAMSGASASLYSLVASIA